MRPGKVTSANSRECNDWQEFIDSHPDSALEQAGLEDANFDSASISLRELTGTAILRIHSLRPFPELRDAMAACKVPLPEQVDQSLGQDPAVICTAPREWLLFSEYLGFGRLLEKVHPVLDPAHTMALNLSAGLGVLRLSGPGSRWLLSKMCGLDFQRGFGTEARSARTRMQQAAVTLHYHWPGGLTSESVFDLIFDRSIARYLWQLLVASAPHAEELQRQFEPGP